MPRSSQNTVLMTLLVGKVALACFGTDITCKTNSLDCLLVSGVLWRIQVWSQHTCIYCPVWKIGATTLRNVLSYPNGVKWNYSALVQLIFPQCRNAFTLRSFITISWIFSIIFEKITLFERLGQSSWKLFVLQRLNSAIQYCMDVKEGAKYL